MQKRICIQDEWAWSKMGLARKWWGLINSTNYYMDDGRQGEGENKIDNGLKFGKTCLHILVSKVWEMVESWGCQRSMSTRESSWKSKHLSNGKDLGLRA